MTIDEVQISINDIRGNLNDICYMTDENNIQIGILQKAMRIQNDNNFEIIV